MTIPEDVQKCLLKALPKDITSIQQVSGGSINKAAKITLSNGENYFLKWNKTANPDMFKKEEKGLELLKSAQTNLRIPNVLAAGNTKQGTGFLIQEFIEEGNSKSHSARNFGKALAELHQQHDDQFGLNHDNYIGRLPQSNHRHRSWVDFFIEERMKPQLQLAINAGKLSSTTVSHFRTMYKQLPDIFPEEKPCLLHGDLWSGNYFYDEKGYAAIYDPAVYFGHREIELAFTYLFGGFPQAFYRAYEEAYPMQANFSDRKDIYNLYPLLVHTNLFGGSYARQVKSIVNQF